MGQNWVHGKHHQGEVQRDRGDAYCLWPEFHVGTQPGLRALPVVDAKQMLAEVRGFPPAPMAFMCILLRAGLRIQPLPHPNSCNLCAGSPLSFYGKGKLRQTVPKDSVTV